MKKRLRRKYEKPQVTKVRLEAKVSVLAVCKSGTTASKPNVMGYCATPSDCWEIGS